ncbi:MAG: FAD-dependent oxidoreductase [Sulfuriferula sp.]|nr:FAD-dependent oxidoreductase [Sulfuriferula sp.]
MQSHSDIIIVGGGPVGATLALALADTPFSVQVLEARTDLSRATHKRTLALSYNSRLILERLGIWDQLQAVTAITDIHISQRGGLGMSQLTAAEESLPALGYVVDYAELDAALHDALRQTATQVVTGTRVTDIQTNTGYAQVQATRGNDTHHVTTRLAVVADGGAGQAQRVTQEYDQHALLATVTTELAHNGRAFERFTPEGPVALLPSGTGFALVWTGTPERVAALLALNDDDFLHALHQHFGDRVGQFLTVSARSSFPLVLRYAKNTVAPHQVLIGNAAQTLHPVAGQGFNLGLRDAWELAQIVRDSTKHNLGDARMLQQFQSQRRSDTGSSIFFTDMLVRLFSNNQPVLKHARSLGLMALQYLPPAKHFVARRMIFGARA